MTLESLGLNTGLIVAMNIIIQFIKNLDKTNRFARFYVFLPLPMAFIAALLVTDWSKTGMAFTQTYLINVILYAALSGYGFKFVQGAKDILTSSKTGGVGTPPAVVDTSAAEKGNGA